MDKRYQVFISSTYADLKEERSKVIQTIMELDCIPAGMEIFPAIDEEQLNFIKSVIDDCDYYILIIGGRYGSISEDGLSYTEKEYDYAIQKGIKVVAFLPLKPEEIPTGKSEQDPQIRQKLEEFKLKVRANRLVKFWSNANELPGLVALSLSKTIKTYPAIGWIRANSVTNPEILKELNEQRKLNHELNEKLMSMESAFKQIIESNKLAGLNDEFIVTGDQNFHKEGRRKWEYKTTWGEILDFIAPYLLEFPYDEKVKFLLCQEFYRKLDNQGTSPQIDNQVFQTIKLHLKALGYVELRLGKSIKGGTLLYWHLTKMGKKWLIEHRSVKKPQKLSEPNAE